jgi:hypothetical protein
VLTVLAGITLIIHGAIDSYGVSSGIIHGLLFLIVGTLCFMMLPMMIVLVGAALRFLPILSIPYQLLLAFGNLFGEQNDMSATAWIIVLGASVWGVWNIAMIWRNRLEVDGDFRVVLDLILSPLPTPAQ